jgi:hypothetical protein
MNMALSALISNRPDRIDRVGPLQTMVFMADGLGPWCSVIRQKQILASRPAYQKNGEHRLSGRPRKSYLGDEVGCGVGVEAARYRLVSAELDLARSSTKLGPHLISVLRHQSQRTKEVMLMKAFRFTVGTPCLVFIRDASRSSRLHGRDGRGRD